MNILARKLLNTYFWSLKLQDVLFMIQRKLKKKVRARTHLKCLIKFVWCWQSLNTLVKLIPLLRYQVALSTVTGYMYMYLSHRHYRASREPVDLLRRGNQLFFLYFEKKIKTILSTGGIHQPKIQTKTEIEEQTIQSFKKNEISCLFHLKKILCTNSLSYTQVLSNDFKLNNIRFCKD